MTLSFVFCKIKLESSIFIGLIKQDNCHCHFITSYRSFDENRSSKYRTNLKSPVIGVSNSYSSQQFSPTLAQARPHYAEELSLPWAFCQIIKLWVAHAPRMPGTFFPPPCVSEPNIHHDTCVKHVPWFMPGLLTCGFLWSWWWENVPSIASACATRNFAYLVRGAYSPAHRLSSVTFQKSLANNMSTSQSPCPTSIHLKWSASLIGPTARLPFFFSDAVTSSPQLAYIERKS